MSERFIAELLWIIPALPLAGFFILIAVGAGLPRKGVALIGAGSVGISAILTILLAILFISSPPDCHAVVRTLWTWMQVAGLIEGLSVPIAFLLDPLSMVMIFVITFVGFLIHLYATEHMKDDDGYSRFFAYMNLFVGSMLILVLAENLLLLYLGWEGVGLCSYLLIGFWYKDQSNGYAARKAFIVTRVGDVALALGLFLLYTNSGTLQIANIMQQATQASGHWQAGSVMVTAAALLLLGGAVGKSAQVPLQTWLPDAMAGPTPVSALIHAATMVTAGVYLIARTHALVILAPVAQTAVALIGAVTLLLAGCSALVQRDIKRVLAYSTISQIGYMFLALGVGAWSAAIFHFMVHAFFKALLFLGAGIIIESLGHERDMFKMGGIRKQLPVVFWTFLVGSASLSAIPLITAGFYSKDLILWEAWASPSGGSWLWLAGLTGAFITSLYTFRMVFLTFFGEAKTQVITQVITQAKSKPALSIYIPLLTLAVLSVITGLPEMVSTSGGLTLFSSFIKDVLPLSGSLPDTAAEIMFKCIGATASLAGVYFSYLFFLKRPDFSEELAKSGTGSFLSRFWSSGWGFDWLYDVLITRPFVRIARLLRDDVFDLVYGGIAWYSELFNGVLGRTQSGNIRWYVAVIACGAILMLVLVAFL
jgi:NADH-quinone oxidoreductase subunit L